MPVQTSSSGAFSSDQKKILQFSRGPSILTPFHCVHHAIEAQASLYPKEIAVNDLASGQALSYEQLNSAAECLAKGLLRQYGVQRGVRVCILMQRSALLIVAILAVLKAGGQYVPLDGGVVPVESLTHILLDSDAQAVLTIKKFARKLTQAQSAGKEIPSLLLDDASICALNPASSSSCSHVSRETDDGASDGNRENLRSKSCDGCYVIYTSGTTGKPKGVDVTHENVTNLLCTAPGNLGIGKGVRVGQVLSISFDMAAWEILGTLMNGGTLVLRSRDWLEALQQVDVLICTPTILARYSPSQLPNIRTVATAGEPCPAKVADEWASAVRYYNCCGPTEVTIVNTMSLHVAGNPLSIGRPTPNNRVYILGEDGETLPIGQVGILWAGGAGISRGYLNLPEKTKERFKSDRFAQDGSMMFNTGDLASWLENGTLEIHGRIDDQVKVQGFRVELDGVSAVIQTCPGITAAAVVYDNEQLWAFVISVGEENVESLVQSLGKALPYYSIPRHILFVKEFPITANGKVDKRSLLTLAKTRDLKHVKTVESLSSGSNKTCSSASVSEVTAGSSGSSVSGLTVDLEKHIPIEPEIPADDLSKEVPDKVYGGNERRFRYRFFIHYRKLFTVVYLVNICIAILVGIKRIPPLSSSCAIISTANLTLAVLIRQDYVINALFTIACAVPTSWPFFIRRNCAKIYHVGGLHTSSASAAVIWFLAATVIGTYHKATGRSPVPNPVVVVLQWLAVVLLVGIIVMAYPDIRKRYHNYFELAHRFAGWTALALIWPMSVLSVNDSRADRSLGTALLHSPVIWMLAVITLSIASSWMRLKRVVVHSEVLSDHAIRLHFDYVQCFPGHFTRISERPLLEWHAFAVVPALGDSRFSSSGNPDKGYSLIVSNAGDWTKRQISRAPKKLWVRSIPAYGVLRVSTLFRSLILIATGSGIGPCLSVIRARSLPVHIIWSTPNPELTFGQSIIDDVLRADPRAIIHNTRTMGRPDLLAMAYNLYVSRGAEAVAIISNEKITKKIVYGLEARGVAAYGAIWDS